MNIDIESHSPEDLSEFAGRACYQSFHKPNPATEECRDYIRNIIEQGHESVLEHGSVSFYITGVSRSFTHELIRHRHLSFSQQSQRFVDESESRFVIPPALAELPQNSPVIFAMEQAVLTAQNAYDDIVTELQEQGLSRKQAREAARAVLPNCQETRIVVTGNHRAWREFLWKRLAPGADAEIREVATKLLSELYVVAPSMYEDIKEHFNL
ncbi:FAD-dependent thymidylate synthase [Corynebacterium propinquum]